jgi:hypothetical protein
MVYLFAQAVIGERGNPIVDAKNQHDSTLIAVLVAGSLYAVIYKKRINMKSKFWLRSNNSAV